MNPGGRVPFADRRKAVLAEVKALARAAGWKYKGGGIFRAEGELFLEAIASVSRVEDAVRLTAGVKPLAADDAFWDIIGAPGNKGRPLSFRADAAFCVRPYRFHAERVALPDPADPRKGLEPGFASVLAASEAMSRALRDAAGFAARLLDDPRLRRENMVALVCTLVALGRLGEAADLLREAKAERIHSGFGFEGGKDFFDLARGHLAARGHALPGD